MTTGSPTRPGRELPPSRQLLKRLFDHAGVGLCLIAPDGTVLRANPQWLRSTGLRAEQVVAANLHDLFPAREGLRELLDRVRRGETVELSRRAQRIGGRETWWEDRCSPVKLDGGTGMLLSSREVTRQEERERAEAAARAVAISEERFRVALDRWPFPFVIYDRERRFEFLNAAGRRLAGVSAEALVGRRDEEVLPPEVVRLYLPALERAIETESLQVVEITAPERLGGATFLISYVPVLDTTGAVERVLGVAYDITDRKRAEEARKALETERERLLVEVRRQAAELEATLFALPDGIVTYDARGNIVRMNPTAAQLFGYSRELMSSPISARREKLQIETADGRPYPVEDLPTERALHGEVVRGAVMSICSVSGTRIWISTSSAPILGAGGEILGAVSSFTDISRIHELQEQREDLIRAVSHDLRSPLSVIYTHAKLLAQQARDPDRVVARAQSIVTSCRRIEAMLSDLSEMGRIEAGQLELIPQRVDLGELVADLQAHLAGSLGSGRVEVLFGRGVAIATADREHVERILTNLLTNALKYSEPRTPVQVSAGVEEDRVTVSVTDRGSGIAREDLPHVFERFYRAKSAGGKEGLGLGLYISRMLAEAQGGGIAVESETGKGSTFRLMLPRAR